MLSPPHRFSGKLDALALALTSACLLHCLILPVAALALPFLASGVHAEWVHWVFVAIAAPTSFMALRHNHHSKSTLLSLRVFAAFGLSLLMFGALGWPTHEFGVQITILGSLVLAVVHLVNYFRKQKGLACSSAESG